MSEDDVQQLLGIAIDDLQLCIDSDDTLKQIIFFIAGFQSRKLKHRIPNDDVDETVVSSAFVKELDRDGLSLPTFVHSILCIQWHKSL